MMPVDSPGFAAIKATELTYLGSHNVFKRSAKPRVKNDLSQAVAPEIPGDPTLMLTKTCGNTGRRKRRCEIQMETGVDSPIPGNCRGSIRILHKYHSADGRHRPPTNAFQSSLGVLMVPAPIIGVYNKRTHARRIAVLREWFATCRRHTSLSLDRFMGWGGVLHKC
jgi:hypothetical protein